ncbi:MAG TPA: MarR family transcriptional regulator [Candidatus Hungatella pullicola]|nr:MarR family transcriptional regulator [Candidatus Hungatella pullicola]
MNRNTDLLIALRRIVKLHDSMLKDVCEEYNLTLIEGKIISFLYNNPEKDTAADIVELRMLSKGNVSQAVESLIQKSLIRRSQDKNDRRKIHLYLTEKAEPVTSSIVLMRKEFNKEVFFGISQEELDLFHKINDKINDNIRKAMTRREKQ